MPLDVAFELKREQFLAATTRNGVFPKRKILTNASSNSPRDALPKVGATKFMFNI